MNKTELVAKVAEKSDITKKQAEAAVKAVFDTITDAMVSGDRVQVIGFGTFETSVRSARTGRNPATGEDVEIPATTVPKFKAGKALKDAVR